MSEVKRYRHCDLDGEELLQEEHSSGEYVLYSDYEHLKTKLELTNKELGLNIKSHLNDICTLEKLKAQLQKAEEVLKAYANCILDQTVHVSIPYDDLDPDDFDVIEEFSSGEPDDIGGKAREYFKEKEQK